MERAEFEQRALSHLDEVYRLALQLTRRPDAADDLVQDVYARAFRPKTIESFEDRSSSGSAMRSWLFTIAHNVFYSKLKRKKLEPTSVGEFFEAGDREQMPDEAPPAWDLASLDWEQVDERLKKAIEDLRDDHRQILLMWGVEGRKYREIAEIMDIPIGTVMSRLHRARKTLAEALGGEDGPAAELGFRPAEADSGAG